MTLKELTDKYPQIFIKKNNRGSWGIPDAWIPLVNNLCSQLMLTEDPPYCVQMKEKFGGLRFYTELESDEHRRLIQQVENNSFDLCQECGSKEDIQRVGTWYKYLCKTCRNES